MNNEEPRKRLSITRLILAIFLLAGIFAGSVFGYQQWQQTKVIGYKKPWFGGYVDVTVTPTYAFEQLGSTPIHNVVLAFIVSSHSDSCTPAWGGVYNLDQATSAIDLDRRIARLRQQGGNIAVSFGGQANSELALKCTNPNKLLAAYKSVVNRYYVDTIDLDIEGSALGDIDSLKRRAFAIATLQKMQRANKKSLAVWLTLPVTPDGLSEEGTNAISIMLANKVDLAGINIMTMDYGSSRKSNQTMLEASEDALNQTHRQLGILYQRAGIYLNNATLWTKIGATPMVGQNDNINDVFTIKDAINLNNFASSVGVGRLSMWSINRDIQCGTNYINFKIVSNSCSGVNEDKLGFATVLSQKFNGDISRNAVLVTTQDYNSNIQQTDDPLKSPYQIWTQKGAYLTGTKVVWHRNVYQAKWWTQGDMPDDPVLQSWQTSWQLVGPVLPGEKPIPQPTLPEGSYPDWLGTAQYQAGQIVLFNGVPYQAKWWTQGDSPAASSANPDSSPWVALTQSQVNFLVTQLKATNSAALSN